MERVPVDEKILARRECEEHSPEQRSCFFCLEGWVFLGYLDDDGEEVVESIRCRRCNREAGTPRYPLPMSRPSTQEERRRAGYTYRINGDDGEERRVMCGG
jgi:hypothetical protein